MDRSLIRNNKDLPENIRDPEQVIGRLQSFLDAHKIGKDFVNPRGPFEDKLVTLDSPSSGKFSPHIHAHMQYEGAVPARDVVEAHSGMIRNGIGPRTQPRLLKSIKEIMSPSISIDDNQVANIDISRMVGSDDYVYHSINPTGSSKPIWEAHRNVVNSIRDKFANPDEHDILSYRDTLEGIRAAREAYPLTEEEQNRYKLYDPRYVDVTVWDPDRSGIPSDVLDLHTGNWARLLQGDQFHLE